jgi:hypothetical protein
MIKRSSSPDGREASIISEDDQWITGMSGYIRMKNACDEKRRTCPNT